MVLSGHNGDTDADTGVNTTAAYRELLLEQRMDAFRHLRRVGFVLDVTFWTPNLQSDGLVLERLEGGHGETPGQWAIGVGPV